MVSPEERIERLEKKINDEMSSITGKTNWYRVGYMQFELSQLYRQVGNAGKADKMIEQSISTLQRPELRGDRKVERLISVIQFYRNNPNSVPMIKLPATVRYLSPIILLVGYVAAYIAYFKGLISYESLFITIIGVFIVGIFASSMLRSRYIRNAGMSFSNSQNSRGGMINMQQFSSAGKNPDDLIDDARAEISLAKMFYSMKQTKEAESHLQRAKMYLDDPLSDKSPKKIDVLASFDKLIASMRQGGTAGS